MIFVADEIPTELRRIVEFLNGQMDPAEVLAIEIKQFCGEKVTAFVPRLLGQTEAARIRKVQDGIGRVRISEEQFLSEFDGQRPDHEQKVARELIAWARENMTPQLAQL